jgi:hypothetical protein
MKSAKTPEERAALRNEMRMAFEQRAKEKGIVLGQRPEGPQLSREDHQRFQERWNNAKTAEEREALRREIFAAVDQHARERGAMRPGQSRPGGPDSGSPMAQLFTPQERDQFRDRMRNAKDSDERMKIRGELHALAEARAREKGIKLPERGRLEDRRGPMEGGPRGPGDRALPRPQG